MVRMTPLRPETTTGTVRTLLEMTRGKRGHGWNTVDTLGHNEHILAMFLDMQKHLPQAGLTEIEREVVAIEIALHNGCHYCLPAHRYVAKNAGMESQELDHLSQGHLSDDADTRLLQSVTRRLLATFGKLDDAELATFRSSGITDARFLAIIGEISLYAMMNMLNRLADTDLDDFLIPYPLPNPSLAKP